MLSFYVLILFSQPSDGIALLSSSFYRGGNQFKIESNLTKVTQLISGRAGIHIQVVFWFQTASSWVSPQDKSPINRRSTFPYLYISKYWAPDDTEPEILSRKRVDHG